MEIAGASTQNAWMQRVVAPEFALLNENWAGRISTLDEVVEAMFSQGLDRMAPIAFDLDFDPAYYREVHPEYAELDDRAVYARWLFHDLASDWAGSPARHLAQLGLPFRRYPEGFDWRAYVAAHPQAGPNAWSALHHWMHVGARERLEPPFEPEHAASLWRNFGWWSRGRDDELAVFCFDRARTAGDRSYAAVHNLADALFRLDRSAEALRAFEEAAPHPEAEVWTYVNGARAALKLDRIDAAYALLAAGQPRFQGDNWWRGAVRSVIEREFELAGEQARAHYAADRRVAADDMLKAAAERVAERYRSFDPLGAPLAHRPDGPVLILANTDLRQCTHYRVEQKQQLLDALGRAYRVFDARNETEAFMTALPGAAAAICYRLPAFPHNVRAIETARAMGVPTFYDIDDLIFDPEHYPEPFETYGGAITRSFYEDLQFGAPLFRAAMAMCDYGLASTTALAERMRPVVRTGQVAVLPNGLDDRNAPFLDAAPPRVRRDDDVVLFYGSGTTAHNTDFLELAGPALLEQMTSDPRIRLIVAGFLTLDERFDAFAERIARIEWTPDIQSYWSLLAEADINLAVLARYPTTDAKSEIKWLEAAALGVPSVVSDTDRYREVLEDGVDALVAADPVEWSEKLGRLIASPELRRRIASAARAKAARLYSVQANAPRLEAALAPALSPAARASVPAAPARRRILLQNIFFPPQTIGGSTRVVRDNLDAFLDRRDAHEFDFAVVASDDGAPDPYRMRVEDYRGVPVFRISVPGSALMEWRPFDPKVGALFDDVLAGFRPDLVHLHAVQRLTATVMERCLAADVPYALTLHDAWYVSDWHFLVDDRGRVRQPCESLPLDPPAGVSIGEALARRRALRPLVDAAAAVLGVSETFTRLHHACGFGQVRALPNGLPPLNPAERTPSASGRVRLCHVGSQTPHKGYRLVQAAFKQGAFHNLELTVVEHARYGGEVLEEVWGATPVRFVGKTQQEHMHAFYAAQDVLLAPSTWPESFGLVSREALAAGLRVVAGDVGAMGEPVIPGVNGWIVDVSGVQALVDVLAEIDADPARFLSPPAPTPMRTSDDQATELLQLYRDLLDSHAATRQS